MQLGRGDLAGKTGTTNDQVDAWFCGFNPSLVAVAWIGFDQPRSLGANETGAQAALPMWMDYMGRVLKGVAETPLAVPSGVVSVIIDPVSGKRSSEGRAEFFYQENIPSERSSWVDEGAGEEVKSQIF